MTHNASSLVHLHYGHLGRPQYNADKNEWTFSKSLEGTFEFRALGPVEVVFASDEAPKAVRLDTDIQRIGLKYLTATLPDVEHIKNVSNLEGESIASAVLGHMHYDPMVGDLLTAAPTRPLLSFPGAEPSVAVKVAKLEACERMILRVESEMITPVDASEVGHEQYWQGLPVRPLQLALSPQASDETEFLAIRYSNHVSFLSIQPFWSAKNHDAPRVQPLKHFLEFTLGRSRKDGIADLCFNPIHSQRFATLTLSGNWAVYDIKRTRMRDHAQQLARGDISEAQNDGATPPTKLDDGWKRIRWFINQSYVVIATRRKLRIQNLTSEVFCELSLDTPSDRRSWILDIRTTQWPNHPKILFVLTTTKILVIHALAPPTGANRTITQSDIQASVKISVMHERDHLDLTAKIKVIDKGNDVVVLLYSKMNSLWSFYKFTINDNAVIGKGYPVSISLPETPGKLIPRILDISVNSMEPKDDSLPEYYRFYQVFILRENDQVETLFIQYCHESAAKEKFYMLPKEDEVAESPEEVAMEEQSLHTMLAKAQQPRDPWTVMELASREIPLKRPTVDRTQLYEYLRDLRSSVRSDGLISTSNTGQPYLMDDLSNILALAQETRVPMQSITLLDLCREPVGIDQLNDLFESFNGLLLEIYDEVPKTVLSNAFKVLFTPQPLGVDGSSLTIERIHQMLTKNYISSLPAEVPDQFRLQRSAILNTVAAEISLASLRLPFVLQSSESSAAPSPKRESHPSSTKVRFQEGPSQKYTHESLSDSSRSSSPDPTSKPTGILSRYVQFDNPSKTRPKTVQNLKHWVLGQDPSDYNYTELLLEERRQAELAELTQEERKRREKAERRKQREQEREQKRFLELSQRTQATQESIIGSQRELTQQDTGTQSRLRGALARRRAGEAVGQSQSQALGPSQAQSDKVGASQRPRERLPKGSQMATIEETQDFTMSGALPTETAADVQDTAEIETQGGDMKMDWELTQPEAIQVHHPPEASQDTVALRPPPASSQVSISASQGAPSATQGSQKPPKKKKRVKGF